jgi:hypothetical protein
MKEECGICGRVLPYYSLRRCIRCGKLYCKACTTFDVTSEDRGLLCLNCARKIVSPKKKGLNYDLLTKYLMKRASFSDKITLSIAKIEGIIANNLPFSAIQNTGWWSNSKTIGHARAWLNAGFEVESIDLEKRIVTFRKREEYQTSVKKRKSPKNEKKEPFVPPEQKKIRKYPSKSKIAKFQARLKNIERRRSVPKELRKFKRRSLYEKKLYSLKETTSLNSL